MARPRQQAGKRPSARIINYGVEARDTLDQMAAKAPAPLGLYAQMLWAKTGGGGIAARSGTTLGSGTVTIHRNMHGTLTATSMTVTAYNGSTTAVAATVYVRLLLQDGFYEVVWEECS